MPAFGKAKSHNWVEADNAFGDFDAIKVLQDILHYYSTRIFEHYVTLHHRLIPVCPIKERGITTMLPKLSPPNQGAFQCSNLDWPILVVWNFF